MLARTVDRARASLAGGTLGNYDPIDSGMSALLLGALKISADDLLQAVIAAPDDRAVYEWVCARTNSTERRAIADRMVHLRLDDLPPERRAHIAAHYAPHLVERCALGFDLLEQDDTENFAEAASLTFGGAPKPK